MKKLFGLALLSLIGSAQVLADPLKKMSLGGEIGVNISNYYGETNGDPYNNLTVRKLRAGVVADYKLNARFSLQSALLYVGNGFEPLKGDRIYSKELQVHTVQLPLLAVAKINARGGNTAFIGLGPYVAANVAGRTNIYHQLSLPYLAYDNISRDLKVGSSDDDDVKMIDYGLCANVGYLLSNGLFLKAHYQTGIPNLLPGGDEKNTMRNFNFGFSVGYIMKMKEHKTAAKPK